MSFLSVISESWRNFCTGNGRFSLLALVLTVFSILCLLFDLFTVSQIQERAGELKQKAAGIRVISSANSISGKACDSLSSVEGIENSGAFQEISPLALQVDKERKISTYVASDGALRLLKIENRNESGVYISNILAERYGYNVGDNVVTNNGEFNLVEIFQYPEDGRNPRLSNAFVFMGINDSFSECWVESWPPSKNFDTLLFAVVNSSGGAPTINPLNPSLGSEYDLPKDFENRPSKYSFNTLVAFYFVIFFIFTRMRKLEISTNFHLGAGRAAVSSTVALEAFYASALSGLFTYVSIYFASKTLLPSYSDFIQSTLFVLFLSSVMAILGSVLGALSVSFGTILKYYQSR